MKKITSIPHTWHWFLFAMFFFFHIGSSHAQMVSWQSGSPSITPSIVGTYGDSTSLNLAFTNIGIIPLISAKIEVTLPAGTIYKPGSLSTGPGHTAGAFSASVSGQIVTITPNGGSIAANKLVNLKIGIIAITCTPGVATVNIGIQGYEFITTPGNANLEIKRPAIRMLTDTPSMNIPLGTAANFDMKLDVPTGLLATIMIVVLKKDAYTTINNIKLGGVDISANTSVNTDSVLIVLNNLNLNATVQHLTFDAKASIVGAHDITSYGMYFPNGAPCGNNINGPTFTFTHPAIPGLANYMLSQQYWVNDTNLNAATGLLPNTQIKMNGVDASYLRLEYTNDGNATVVETKATLQAKRGEPYGFGYIDTSKIYYSINGAPKVRVLPANIEVTASTSADNGYRKLRTSASNKPEMVRITVKEEVVANAKIIFYWPVIQGDIYDNTTYRPTIDAGAYPYSNLQFLIYDISGLGSNGNSVSVPTNTYGVGGINIPKFTVSPSATSFREGSPLKASILLDLGSNNLEDNQTTDFVIKLPSWLELDGTPETAIHLPAANLASGYPIDEGNNTYRLRYTNDAIGELKVKYKAKIGICSGVNINGEIEYWLDYNLGGNNATIRPVLRQIAKIYQPVTLLCEEEGLIMGSFSLHRITRGLKDNDENYVPDDGTPAENALMLHNVYLRNDFGKMIIQHRVTTGSYSNLYILLKSSSKILPATFQLGDATIKIGLSNPETVTLTSVNDSMYYIAYPKSLNIHDRITVEINFQTIEANNISKTFSVQSYVTTTPIADPFNPGEARVGTNELFQSMITYSESFSSDKSSEIFSDNSMRTDFILPNFDCYHGNSFSSPYFAKEIRRIGKMQSFTLELPKGYLIGNQGELTLENMVKRDQHTKNNPQISTSYTSETKTLNGSTIYTYDLTQVFQDNVNTQAEADALPPTKWMYPDDLFNYHFTIDIQATKGALATSQIKTSVGYLNSVDNNSLYYRDFNFSVNYIGDKYLLTVNPDSISANSQPLKVSAVTLDNPNNFDFDSWIYVAGKIRDVKMQLSPSDPIINGEGINGRWVHVGLIPANSSVSYMLTAINTNTTCDIDSLTIYGISGFQNTSWVPNTAIAPDPNDTVHVAGQEYVLVFPPKSTIDAEISVSTQVLKYGSNGLYTVDASIDGRSSEGDLHKAEIWISIPIGQKYVANSGRYTYPSTNVATVLPPAVEAILLSTTTDTTIVNPFAFRVADFGIQDSLLPGFANSNGISDEYRVLKMTADFVSTCTTPLTGISYSAILSGQNQCGLESEGSQRIIYSAVMFPATSNTYNFQVDMDMTSGNRAFNEMRTEDQLIIDITKNIGTDTLMADDKLQLQLPKWIDIKTPVNISSTDIPDATGEAIIISNTEIAGNMRLVEFKLPVDLINLSTDAGLYLKISYAVDIQYEFADNNELVLNTPIQTITAQVISRKIFSPDCDGGISLKIGANTTDIALVTASDNPYSAYRNQEKTMEIISANFEGKWYDAQTGGTELSTSKTYLFTPLTRDPVTLYVSSIFGATDYGRVPIQINILIPLEYTVDNTTQICENSSVDLSSLVMNYEDGLAFKFYNDVAAQNELPSPIVSPTVNTTYYVQSEDVANNRKGIIDSILITTKPTSTITTEPASLSVESGSSIMLSVVATGANLTYQWRKGGVDIAGETTDTYTKAVVDSTDNGVYSVIVSGECSADTSSNATVLVYPILTFSIDNTTDTCQGTSIDLLALLSNYAGGITFKFYSDHAALNELPSSTVTPQDTTTYYVQSEDVANNRKGIIDSILITTKPTSTITTEPASLSVESGSSITLSVVATGTNLTYQWRKDATDIMGETTDTYTKAVVDSTDNGVYSVIVSGECSADTSSNATVLVYPILTFSIDNTTDTCQGTSIDLLSLLSDYAGGITFKFYSDHAALNELPSSTVTPQDTTTYYVQSEDVANNRKGIIDSILITTKPTSTITTEPVSLSVESGSSITLSVVATGTNLTYQWRKGGVDIAGETTDTYTKAVVDSTDNGVYSVIVSGECSADTSTDATVLVYPILTFSIDNTTDTCQGTTIDLLNLLSDYAGGITFKFYSDHAALNELPSSTVTPQDTTTYYVQSEDVVNNRKGIIDSILITIKPTSTITTEPVSLSVESGSSITLSVVATGTNLTYQWRKGGVDIAGETTDTYTKAVVDSTDNGVYSVIVSGECSADTSSNATVLVYAALDFTVDSVAVCMGTSVDLSSLVSGYAHNITIRYYSDATAISELSNTNVIISSTTDYYVQSSNPDGIKSATQKLTIKGLELPTAIISASATVCPGTDTPLNFTLTGTAPWIVVYSNGITEKTFTDITSNPFVVTELINGYTVFGLKQITDSFCSNIINATVIVNTRNSSIVAATTTKSHFCEGDDFTLTANTNNSVLSYQWYKDNSPINGAISSTLTVNNAAPDDKGAYMVEITDECDGMMKSEAIAISYNLDPSLIIEQKWNNTLVLNNNSATNGGYTFTSYKWTKNNDSEILSTKPYYSAGNEETDLLDPNSDYFVELTTQEDSTFRTCAYRPKHTAISIIAYPNPIISGNMITVEANLGINELNDAVINIYNISGMHMGTNQVDNELIQVSLPSKSGIYTLQFKSKNVTKYFKILVK